MPLRIAINGLGRIGRCVLRAIYEYNHDDIVVVAVNGPAPTETHAQLLKYDSIHGPWHGSFKVEGETIDFGKGPIPVYHERDPRNLPWKKHNVDVVLECSGVFKKRADAALHLEAGAKKVLISAPAPDPDATIVYGVNHDILTAEHDVISVGSCTTNALAPLVKVLNSGLGIERGFMTTIHAYTGDQNHVDGSHKDLRRARACAMSMIPTSTGAAKALSLVLPEMVGKLDGTSIRVPTPNVSLVDLVFDSTRPTTVDEVNSLIQEGTEGALQTVLGICDEPLVSIDFNHTTYSSIFDLSGTHVTDGSCVRVMAWYDNEWGFSCRMLDVAKTVGAML